MQKILFLLILIQYTSLFSQEIHPLEPASNHYMEFQKLDGAPSMSRTELDSIAFLPSQYNSVALLYTMMSPAYLSQNQIDDLKNSLKQPANSSEQTKAELEFLLNWQIKRTKTQEVRAAEVLAPVGYWPHINVKKDHPGYEQNKQHLFFEGRTIMGDQCTEENYPSTFKFMQGITKDMRIMEFTVKYHLLRPRPYVLESKLTPLAIMSSPSFASGHTLWAYIQAFAWSELIPEKRQEFLELAYEIGESREIMGIHYPSDEEAARVLAHGMLSAMWSNPIFSKDLKAAKLEWKNTKTD
ncbi:phosphatase PAP2 family protein [Maribacter algarum]|nr:phosphatase PAP2 family protein [Maribacter algarum]